MLIAMHPVIGCCSHLMAFDGAKQNFIGKCNIEFLK